MERLRLSGSGPSKPPPGRPPDPIEPSEVIAFDKLTPKQREAGLLLGGSQRHTCLFGGARSGKTAVIIYALITRALKAPNSRHAILRHHSNAVWPSIGLQTWPFVTSTFFPWLRFDANKSMRYFELPNGSQIWLGGLVGGLDEGRKPEKILGNEYSSIFFNECSQIPYQAVLLVLTRLAEVREGLKQRAYYDLNPVGRGHWTNVLFNTHRDPVSKQAVDIAQYRAMQLNPKDNEKNLSPEYLQALEKMPDRQRRRFYEGEYVDELENALWTIEVLEENRIDPLDLPEMARVIVAVDPSGAGDPADMTHDAIGIVVVGLGKDGHGYVLDDQTILAGPERWGRRAVAAYDKWKADRIVAEINFGGAMVEYVIRTVDPSVSFKMVSASRGKVQRAEPVSALYNQKHENGKGKVHHVGRFEDLEDEMCDFTDLGYVGERSPNRADALVWGISELMLNESQQSWIDHYASLTAKRGVTSVVETRIPQEVLDKGGVAGAMSRLMQRETKPAPRPATLQSTPNACFYIRNRSYQADAHGFIHDVNPDHVALLVQNHGCRALVEETVK